MNDIVRELEHRDHERAVGHIVLSHPLPFSLVASSHIGFLAAAGNAVLRLYEESRGAHAPFRVGADGELDKQ